MPDEVLPDAPMAVIPGANGGMLDFLSPKSTFPQDDEEASAPSSESRSQQASTFEYLSDAQFDAMLVANSATPPPFETVNPSALSSPGPATDFSSSDDGVAMHNPSPFQPANYQFFGTDSIRSSPFTTNIPPLSAPIARRYSRHLSLHDGAHTEPHASPVGFPLNEQSPEPPADQPPGMYFTLHRHLQARLMQEDDGNQSRNYYQSQPHTVAPAQNQPPRADGPRHVPSPTPSPHPYPPAQPHHQPQELRQQYPASLSAPPQTQVTFHRQSGHYIGQPRPRRHPYPPAAPRQAPPPNVHQTTQGHTTHPAQDQPGNEVDNMNLLSMRGTVRIGTPVAPPPPPASSSSSMPDHPPPSTSTMASTSSPTPASPPSSSGPASSPGPASPRPRPQQQHQRDGGGDGGGSSGSNDDDGSTSTSSNTTTTNIRTSSSRSSRTRSNTAPTPPSGHHHHHHHHHSRAVSAGRMVRQAPHHPYPYPYPSPASCIRPASPFRHHRHHHPSTPLPHHPLHQHQHQQAVRGVDGMGNHRRGVGSNVRSGCTPGPGPTSAPMAKKSMMPVMMGSSSSSAAHARHQRMWTPEPAAAAIVGGGGGGGAFAEGLVGEGRVRLERTRRGHDTLVLGIQAILERIDRECDGLNEWVREAVEVRGEGEEEGELERKRLEKRNKNFAVTEVDEPLEPLPRTMQLETGLEDIPWDVPPNAQGIRNLDHDTITPLLEAYSIPFQSDMFLGQKKELYLRFIGANRALMHRVLD